MRGQPRKPDGDNVGSRIILLAVIAVVLAGGSLGWLSGLLSASLIPQLPPSPASQGAYFRQPPIGKVANLGPGVHSVEAVIPDAGVRHVEMMQFSYNCSSAPTGGPVWWEFYPLSLRREGANDNLVLRASLDLSDVQDGRGNPVDEGAECELRLTYFENGSQGKPAEGRFHYHRR